MLVELCLPQTRYERSVQPHRHERAEWHFAIAGCCGFDIEEGGVELKPGDFLAVAPGCRHRLRVRRPGEWLVQIIFATTLESAEDEALQAAFLKPAGTHRLVHVGRDRHAFFVCLGRDLGSADPFRRRAAMLRFTCLLCDVVSGGTSRSHPAVERALALMRERLDGRLDLEELALAAGCSRSLLARRFRAEVGEPPSAHFLAMRLDLAADLLRQGGLAVGAVAGRCGFTDPYHFSRCFRKRFGRPPSTWS